MSATPDHSVVPRWRELFTDGRGRTTVGLVLMETVVAIQVLVTVAVLPAVVGDLGGLRLYGVALSASALATVVVLPVTPRLVLRWGLRNVFYLSAAVFLAGSVVVLAAPDMPIFVAGRLIQGAGGGAQYALLLAIVTRRYPARIRPRMFAALTVAWAVPGLVGPAYGGLVATALGWRWAFALILPLLVPAVLLLRRDFNVAASTEAAADGSRPAALSASIALGGGLTIVLTSLALDGVVGVVLAIVGLGIAVIALRTILPTGSFSARFGLPAVIATAFLVNTAYFGVEGFLPAMLTGVHGQSLTAADLIVTCGVLTWVAGTWFQSRFAGRWPARSVVATGAALALVGTAGVVVCALGAPLPVSYIGWAAAGWGMGMAYPTIALLATELATPGSEVITLAQYQVAEILGSAVGPCMVGAALSVALSAGLGLQDGLVIGFAATCSVLVVLLAATHQLPASVIGTSGGATSRR